MSKIEEALNKARKSHEKRLVVVDSTADFNQKKNVSNNDLMSTNESSKEIQLMEDGDLLENCNLSDLNIIFSDMPNSSIVNSFRDIRTKILSRFKNKNISILITSCVTGDSSTYTAVNLAAAFSFDLNKTSLLVDCNINKPKINKMLNIKSDVGLSDYLENNDIDVSSIIQSTGIKRLRAITAGTKYESAVEYFTLDKMKALLSSLLDRYNDRYIFIDSPSISESANTRILVDYVDAVVLVVPYGKVSVSAIKESIDEINKEKLMGVVFSEVPGLSEF